MYNMNVNFDSINHNLSIFEMCFVPESKVLNFFLISMLLKDCTTMTEQFKDTFHVDFIYFFDSKSITLRNCEIKEK